MPRYPRVRPDFQARGPRVLVEKTINFEKLDALDAPDEDNEVDELASYGPPKVRYYDSEKVLGRLYREIDERKFFAGIEERSQRTSLESHSLVDAVWSYVQDKTVLIEWKHYIEFAEDVMER